jgi:hypothetical protein
VAVPTKAHASPPLEGEDLKTNPVARKAAETDMRIIEEQMLNGG